MNRIRTVVIEDREWHNYRAAWLALLPSERWSFFLHPGWCHAVWSAFSPGAKIQLHLAFDGDRLIGLLPTCSRRMNRFGLWLPVTEAFAGARGDYSAPLVTLEPAHLGVQALIASAMKTARKSGALVLANIPDDTGIPAAIEEYLQSNDIAFTHTRTHCLRLEIPAGTVQADVLISKKRRADIRRNIKRLEREHGDLTFRVVTSLDEAQAMLPLLFGMHDRRWNDAGRPGSFTSTAMRDYYARLLTDLWTDGVHFSVTLCGNSPIAFHVGMLVNGHILYYKPTFEPDLQRYSPGYIHVQFLIQHAIDEGLSGIDFLQGDEAYKGEWASASTATSTFLIRPSFPALSYFWLARGRRWAENKLGPAYLRMTTLLERYKRN